MKTLLPLCLLLICGAPICMAGPKEDFVEKVKAAHASGSVDKMMELYAEGMPEDLRLMYRMKMEHILRHFKDPEIEVVPYDSVFIETVNGEATIRGTVYVNPRPVTEQVKFKKVGRSHGLSVTVIDGEYFIAVFKPK